MIIKLDISPVCGLGCTVCIHTAPVTDEGILGRNGLLGAQRFEKSQRMSVDRFTRIVDEVAGKTQALSLYYLGEPYMHSDVDEMCGIAFRAGLNVHINTHFSLSFSDDRIERIARSGVTHLTVCVDGSTQDVYEITRVGGKLDHVMSNLRRLTEYKKKHKLTYPRIEVQYIKFAHNQHQFKDVQKQVLDMGVNQVTSFWGNLHNWIEEDVDNYDVFETNRNSLMPQCYWPYSTMLIKYNGDVIPCALHRIARQHTDMDGKRIIGNVFESGVAAVWNGETYKCLRERVANPELGKLAKYQDSFCDGCDMINKTNLGERVLRRGEGFGYEEVIPRHSQTTACCESVKSGS